jgi:hypothetical protein
MKLEKALQAIDKVIEKSRVHLYKPIQIAEILYRDRVIKDIDLSSLETYRTSSKRWRDVVCLQFLGRTSTSSAKYQDDIFSETAVPPHALVVLGDRNRETNGEIEAYIYRKFSERFNQMSSGLDYTRSHDETNFDLKEFLDLFWMEPGLRRSIDKIYEIVVYALFSAIVEALEVSIEVSIDENKKDLLIEFEDFAKSIIQISQNQLSVTLKAKINRVGVTNAADRGLDMWANFGMAIQIKHLSLTEELAENIVSSVTSDRIVIVCKDSEERLIVSLLTQIGWKSKIQSIVTESHLIDWYQRALRGRFSNVVGSNVIRNLNDEIMKEFPTTDKGEFNVFIQERGYNI